MIMKTFKDLYLGYLKGNPEGKNDKPVTMKTFMALVLALNEKFLDNDKDA